MSILPYLLGELQVTPRRQYVRPFDLDDILPHLALQELLSRQAGPVMHTSGHSTMKNDGKEFRVNLDVQQFKPEEVTVKVVDDFIVVEGQHEERQDEHGYVKRQFQRRYLIPQDVDPNGIQSTLSSDGVLTVCAPKKAIQQAGERQISIVHTNKPAISNTKPTPSADGDKAAEK